MKQQHKDNYYVFTGGPGSGKTSVIEHLDQHGYQVVAEVGRDIIQQQQQEGGNKTHTGDQAGFCELMLESSIANYNQYLSSAEPVFFDRAIPGLVGYCQLVNIPSKAVDAAAQRYRYNPNVFIFPPWEEIYQNDTERQQDYKEAVMTYNCLKYAHLNCGYHLIEVPKLTIVDRVKFIVSHLGANSDD